MSSIFIERENYTVEFEEPELYVDNKTRGRSGHMTHGLAQFAPGCFIDFNSNCSPVRWSGHSPYGWVEYRISRDAGKTYSEIKKLPYAEQSFYDGLFMISVEAAVACDDGSIVAFCLKNDGLGPTCCEPWDTPMFVRSTDEGETWSEAVEFSPYKGRTYDAIYVNGTILVMHHCNERFEGKTEEHVYRLYASTDNGQTFSEYGIIPIDPIGRNYGTLLYDDKGVLHAYTHNENANFDFDHAISRDMGKTWEVCTTHLDKGCRNPHVGLVDGIYIMHGRSEDYEGLVLYTSEDGQNWDEGTILVHNKGAAAFYSNNLNLTDEKGNFLLVQYSDRYFCDRYNTPANCRVNVMHSKIRIKK